jgi:hypothetical protein
MPREALGSRQRRVEDSPDFSRKKSINPERASLTVPLARSAALRHRPDAALRPGPPAAAVALSARRASWRCIHPFLCTRCAVPPPTSSAAGGGSGSTRLGPRTRTAAGRGDRPFFSGAPGLVLCRWDLWSMRRWPCDSVASVLCISMNFLLTNHASSSGRFGAGSPTLGPDMRTARGGAGEGVGEGRATSTGKVEKWVACRAR